MIIFKNENFIICKKVIGISSQKSSDGKDMICLISEKTQIPQNEIHPIHRLDNPVGGTILYGIGPKNAAQLSKIVSGNKLHKEYLAVIHGEPMEPEAVFKDLLFKDSSKNKSYVVQRMRKGVKEASLEYKVLSTVCYNEEKVSLVRIILHTGRTHQIRVQFSHRKMPLMGDRRYGSGKDNCTVALWSHRLKFISPFDGKEKMYSSVPDTETFPWCLFDKSLFL